MSVPLCLNSVISNTNQDSFIQRALNASHAYTNIIESIRQAETLAGEANMETLEVMLSYIKPGVLYVSCVPIHSYLCT